MASVRAAGGRRRAAGGGRRAAGEGPAAPLLRDALSVRRVAAVGAAAQGAGRPRVARVARARAVEAEAVLRAVRGAAAQGAIETGIALSAVALHVDALAAAVARVGAAGLFTLGAEPAAVAEARAVEACAVTGALCRTNSGASISVMRQSVVVRGGEGSGGAGGRGKARLWAALPEEFGASEYLALEVTLFRPRWLWSDWVRTARGRSLLGQDFWEQSMPSKPSAHSQAKSTHLPCPEQSRGHVLTEQSCPL